MVNEPGYHHGIYAAPWTERGAEYGPVSVRSGREVAQSTAERDWAESSQGHPTSAHPGGGLWDHDEDRATRQRELARLEADGRKVGSRWPHKALGRYDDARMARWVETHAEALTARLYEIYHHFWLGRLSYGQIARRLDCRRERVREAVKELRARCERGS